MQLYVKTIDMVVNFRDVDQCQRWVQARLELVLIWKKLKVFRHPTHFNIV